MDIGKIINHLSSRLKSRSQVVHTSLGIGNAQGKILNFILVESTLHPVYQKDIEREFSLRPPPVDRHGDVKVTGIPRPHRPDPG